MGHGAARPVPSGKRRCLLLGLDGATFDVLDPLIRDGVMPFLGRFLDGGARAPLRSVAPPLTFPAWTSLATGQPPGRHGVLDFNTFESPSSLFLRFAMPRDIACETIWSMLSRQRRRVACLNFPLMLPPHSVNGCVIPGWLPQRWLPRACHPPGLYERLEKDLGLRLDALAMRPEEEVKAIEGCQNEDYEDWVRFHIEREEQWFLVLSRLLADEPFDLAAVVFDGIDKIQHLCWRFIDPAGAAQSPSPLFLAVRDLCLQYFGRLDRCLEALVEQAGPETTVLMASDHGFGPTDTVFSVNVWLERNGHLAWRDGADAEEPADSPRISRPSRRIIRQLDRARTRACALTPSANAIFLLVDGQRGPGGLSPAEYEPFRRRLTQDLLAIRNPATGEPLVRRVLTREEAFAGPFLHKAPDLTLELQDYGLFSVARNPEPIARRKEIMGCHRPLGVFAARGPGIQAGLRLEARSIMDVAPTILYALGLPIPDDLEGRLIEEMHRTEWLKAHAAARCDPSPPSGAVGEPSVEMDDEDQEQIAARLRALGYME